MRERIAADLLTLGVQPGGALLVHSSFRALGPVPAGLEEAIQGLLLALGAQGTLLFPALTYERVTPQNPVFDVRRTRSDVGALSEYFRTRPGTRRSLHPTHSVCAVGPLAGDLLDAHRLDATPCGAHSPFRRLCDVGGQILMLGCGLKPNTSMHAIEELVEPPYLYGPQFVYRLIHSDGRIEEKIYRVHGFAGYEQRYDRVADVLSEPALRRGPVLRADAYLLDAPALWAAVLPVLRESPLYFVDGC
ncbi:MAG: AAC(3) family N-acetyltransferase [Anaerolineae bacterium]|nr:AAC(3) family N-acetyltransferase [Anaerolineae bacterium]